ncbi:hypothetical protein B0H17DRAFT_1139053 [Mycena rosella]|uniref:Uncharacterized protein n=1 Tax=Mycena rosella TaxID=1033263 RepID=A0AAD7D5J0_MYCRO|nr:hypothetical protein B0H17DRAFT_1139053 [Mycena rosella]
MTETQTPSSSSRDSSREPAAKRRRVDDPVTAAALARHQQISALLDLHPFDDDEDDAECDEDPTLNESDLDFIDDDEELPEAPVLLHRPTEDVGPLAQIAARFEQDAAAYTESAQSEQTEMREVSAEASVVAQTTILQCAVQDAAHSILPRPAPNLDRADGHVVPRPPALPTDLPRSAAQIAHGVHSLLKPPKSLEPARWTPAGKELSKKRKEGRQLEKLARQSRGEPDPDDVEPRTWIHLKQEHAGCLAFTISAKECIVARKTRDHFIYDTDQLAEVDDGCEMLTFSRPLSKKVYPRVYPTLDELEPFQRSRRPIFTITDFVGHAQALQLCDRVKVWRGARTGTVGYIVDVLDAKVNRKDPPGGQTWVTMMKLSPVLLLPSVGGEIAGEWFQLGALRRHILSPSPPLQLLHRVRVIGNRQALYKVEGYVIDICADENSAGLVTVEDVHGNRASIPMTNVERAFRLADKVIVKRGEHKGRQGIVLDRGFFFLEIFDGHGHILDDIPTMQHEAIVQRHMFCVPLVDVDFDMFRDSTSNPEYFPTQSTVSVVSHLDVPLPRRTLSVDEGEPMRPDREAAHLDKLLKTVHSRLPAGEQVSPEQIARFKERLGKRAQEQNEALYAVGHRYEDLHVMVVGARMDLRVHSARSDDGLVRMSSPFKGRRGLVIGDHDSADHVQILFTTPATRRRQQMRRDTRGIMVTIREMSNREITVPIELVVHEATGIPLEKNLYLPRELLSSYKQATVEPQPRPRTPTPPPCTNETSDWGLPEYEKFRLEGEYDGKWMCIPELAGKRIDVIVEGITRMVATRNWKPSPVLSALEGKTGYLLLHEAIRPSTLREHKITVYAVGNNGRKHDVPGVHIKPLRDGVNGMMIIAKPQRVVVIGGDMAGDTSAVGTYAQTRPDILHGHGPHVVAVMLEGGAGPLFFHILRLSRTTNTTIQNVHMTFPATIF